MEIQLRAIYPPLLAGEGVEQTTRNTLAPYTRVYNTRLCTCARAYKCCCNRDVSVALAVVQETMGHDCR